MLFPIAFFARAKPARGIHGPGPIPAYSLQGSFLAFRTDQINQVGCFDERTFLYFEESILSEKFRRSGFHAAYVPGVQVLHYHEQSTRRIPSIRRHLIYSRSLAIYLGAYRSYTSVAVVLCRVASFIDVFLWAPLRAFVIKALRRRGTMAGRTHG